MERAKKLFSSELNPFIIGFISQESNLSKNKLFLQLKEDMFILIKIPVPPLFFFVITIIGRFYQLATLKSNETHLTL